MMLAAVLASLVAFTAQDSADIKVDVEIVRVPCTVTDKKGLPAKNLVASDFTIRDNGAQRKIKYFARDTDLPLTVGLLVDVSGSQSRFISRHRRALAAFFEKILRPGDQVFVAALARDVRLIQDFTGSLPELDAAIDRVTPSHGTRMGKPCPVREIEVRGRKMRFSSCGGSVIWDGIYYSVEKLRAVEGRKALIVMTDGEDSGSPHSLEEAIGMAQAAETVVYTIKTVNRQKLRDALKKPLEKIAEQSGGEYFDGKKQRDSAAIFQKIQEDLRTLYMLGFNAEGQRDGSFHELRVTAARGLKVRTRSGYWARKE
jgi:VWFA-related protein